VTHVEGEVNPIRDLDIINEELRLKDEEYLSTHLEKLERTVLRGGDKKLKPEYVSPYSHRGFHMASVLCCLVLRFFVDLNRTEYRYLVAL